MSKPKEGKINKEIKKLLEGYLFNFKGRKDMLDAQDLPAIIKKIVDKYKNIPRTFTLKEIRRAIEIHNSYHHTWSDSGLAWNEFIDFLVEAKRQLT